MSSFVINEDWLETILPSAAKVPRIMIRPHPKDKHDEYNGKVQVQGTGEVRSYPHLVGAFGWVMLSLASMSLQLTYSPRSAHMKFAWVSIVDFDSHKFWSKCARRYFTRPAD